MPSAPEKIKVLIVDDREENLLSLKTVLDSPEYELVTAKSGSEALKQILTDEFALILLDVQMPEMDGFETAALIKRRERSRNIPIIFITALSREDGFVFRGYDAGAVDYLVKPFDPHILRSKVAVFAELHRITLQNRRQAELLREADRVRQDRLMARLELESLRREQSAYQKYRDLVDGLNQGLVWVADPLTLCFKFVNAQHAEALLGVPETHWNEPGAWLSRLHPEERDELERKFKEAILARRDFSFEHRFLRANGEIIWFHTGVKLSPTTNGAFELQGLSINVTHLKEAEEAARNALRIRDDFLSIASHELKTPLTPLKLQLQLLRRIAENKAPEAFIREKLIQMLDISDRQVDRLVRLVNELLDVGRIHNGKLVLVKEKFCLSAMVREVLSRFAYQLTEARCKIVLNLEKEVIGSWDSLRIEQVFVNLISNAAKYGEGKPIEISSRIEDGKALLEVRDHGVGISPVDQVRIFDRFERASNSASFGGLGLGLYIVKQIVDAHEGEILVESEPGRGSVFTVALPLARKCAELTSLQPVRVSVS